MAAFDSRKQAVDLSPAQKRFAYAKGRIRSLAPMGQSRNLRCTAAVLFFSSWVCFAAAAADIPATCPTAPNPDAKTLRRLARTAQPDRGFLWEISKDGRRSFVYATVHVAKRFCRDRDVQLNEAALLPPIKTPASRTDLLATRFAL